MPGAASLAPTASTMPAVPATYAPPGAMVPPVCKVNTQERQHVQLMLNSKPKLSCQHCPKCT
eukprot:1142707-Pelagomonas_calceolata.AAC.10